MLIAIEGCDRAGKTTLFEQLKPMLPFATFVSGGPFAIEFKPIARLVEERDVRLWSQLYDRSKVYVADRCPFVSNVVYAEVYGRPPVSYPEWDSELRVLYLRPSIEVLKARGHDDWNPDFARERGVYDEVIGRLQHEVVETVEAAVAAVHTWVVEGQNVLHGVRERAKELRQLVRRGRAAECQRRELLAHEVALQRARVEDLRGYWRGSFGQPLGLPAVGPCVLQEKPARSWDVAHAMPAMPSGAVLCHRCDERCCVEPRHLFWGTQRDNVRDMQLKGRAGRGRPHAELLASEEAVLKIRLQELIDAFSSVDSSTFEDARSYSS